MSQVRQNIVKVYIHFRLIPNRSNFHWVVECQFTNFQFSYIRLPLNKDLSNHRHLLNFHRHIAHLLEEAHRLTLENNLTLHHHS